MTRFVANAWLWITLLSIGVTSVVRAEPEKTGSTGQKEDPAPGFIAQMDAAPPDKRPPNWDDVKKLMARKPPAVGDPAPDFTLKTQDDSAEITRSTHQAGRPQVLIFGSFT